MGGGSEGAKEGEREGGGERERGRGETVTDGQK